MIPSGNRRGSTGRPVYQRGLVIDSQLVSAVFDVGVSISKGIGD